MDHVLLEKGADLVSSHIFWILIIAVDDYSCNLVICECEVATIVCDRFSILMNIIVFGLLLDLSINVVVESEDR
jgi:hypothetical protein